MSQKVFDALTLMWDAVSTTVANTWTIAASPKLSTAVDLKAADIDEESPGTIQLDWQGITSAGAATIVIAVQDSADNVTFATISTSEAYAKTAVDLLDWRFPLPTKNLRRYVRLAITIAVADISAGTITAGLVK